MTVKTKFSHKVLSVFLCVVLMLSYIPFSALAAPAVSDYVRTADASTMDGWKTVFKLDGLLDTENAGGVWTDKSVFTKNGIAETGSTSVFNALGISPSDENFIVALSALASNMTISGQSSVPTDTILALDISGSMNDDNNNVAAQLVTATNTTVKALLDANKNNRVGVVLYSGPSSQGSSDGDDATVALPLGRYTTSDTEGRFFNYNSGYNESISLNNNVFIEGTSNKPTSTSKTVVGGTYIQNGINLAKDQFLSITDTTVTDTSGASIKRKPIIVLLSDGAPTLGSTDFTNISSSNLGDGTSSSAAIGFVTQLTIAYAKQQLDAHYNSKSLLYTLGVGIKSGMNNYNIAEYVLNPLPTTNNTSANGIRDFWTQYNEAEVDDTVTVQGSYNYNRRRVTKIDATLEQYYVDKYFDTANYSTNLQEALVEAFKDIVADIEKQSEYFPTFVETTGENASGFVTFVDKIGKYMKVADIKGITVDDNKLFSGKEMAKALVDGSFGTTANPTALGDNFVWAVRDRLGVKTVDEVRALIGVAYETGQLSYVEGGDYSNYIGWCADENGAFLGHWYEGIAENTIPVGTKYIVKSYGYLGETDAEAGVSKSDMMYAVIQVREDISTGEQQITFSIPAALVPIVTYNVDVNEAGECNGITISGALAPMRFIYEVGLDSRINEYNLSELVDEEYLNANTQDGKVNFFTNMFESDHSVGFDSVTKTLKNNTYSYFKPSMENDRYYFQNSSRLYTENGGDYIEYTDGTVSPADLYDSGVKLYRKHLVYKQTGTDTYANAVNYAELSRAILEDAKFVENEWIIESGHVRLNTARYNIEKTDQTITGSLPFANEPFVDIGDPDQNNEGHRYTIGSTLGNNGRISVPAKTGIKISKSLADGVASTQKQFSFKITTVNTDNSIYNAYKVDANGIGADTTVAFNDGIANNITLMAGEAIYIEGLTENQIFTVTENLDIDYKLDSVFVNGVKASGAEAQLTVANNRMQQAEFVNTNRGAGDLTIAKEVIHPFTSDPATLASKEFTMQVTLELDGNVPLANYNRNGVATDAEGNIIGNVVLKHSQQIQLNGLPAGTVATVREISLVEGDGYTAAYFENGQPSVSADKGVVTVAENRIVSVIVTNDYEPAEIQVNDIIVNLEVKKNLANRENWLPTDQYKFILQRRDTVNNVWVDLGNGTIDTEGETVDFTSLIQQEKFDSIGSYYYRVVEEEPTDGTAVKGVDYDKEIHAFYIVVSDVTMDGKLEISDVVSQNTATTVVTPVSGTYQVDVTFNNIYQTDATNATIEIQKTVENPSNSLLGSLDGFEFKITECEADGVIKTGAAPIITPKTSITGITRISITHTEIGKYYYVIEEIAGDNEKWIYSDKKLYVTVEIIDSGEGYLIAKTYEGLNLDAEDIPDNVTHTVTVGNTEGSKFINTYNPQIAELELDFVNKSLTGRDYDANEFEFKIEGYNYNLIDAEGKDIADNVIIGKNGSPDIDGNSKVVFTPNKLYFNKVGIYYHNITEVNKGKGGVTYDSNVARLTVTVVDNNGILSAAYEIVNITGDQVSFVNTYVAQPVKKAITATKNLIGRALINDEFTFILQEAVNADGELKVGGDTYEVKNALDGSVIFPEINYTAAGTYYYVVSEKQPEQGTETFGLSYDDRKFIVTLDIKDDGLGSLVADTPIYKLLGNGPANAIVFNNTYTATPTSTELSVNKTLDGRILNADEFSFELVGAKGTVIRVKDNEIVKPLDKLTGKNDADGKIDFGYNLYFDMIGTYWYEVTEIKGNKGGITYDETVYSVKVEITDDLRGKLHSKVNIYDENGIPQASVEFVNIYTITGVDKVTLIGEKTLEGRDMVDGEFTFELYETDNTFTVGTDADKTTTNNSGEIKFELDYGPDDVGKTFYYVIKEKNGGQTINGVTYSDVEYQVTVKVEDNGDGDIKTTTEISIETLKALNIDFKNEFNAITEVDINVNKKVENKGSESITAEGFEFQLKNVETNEKLFVKSDKDGKAKFSLPFTQKDIGNTYYYKLTEVNGNKSNVKYSTAAYDIEISITVNDNGELVAAVKQGNLPVENAVAEFINEYDYTPPVEEIPISPPTGDATNIHLWIALLFVSGGVLIGASAYGKREDDAE